MPGNFSELTSEKSLFAIYRKYRKGQKIGKFNGSCLVVFAFVSFAYLCGSQNTINELAENASSTTDLALQIVTQLLGFLIAGYTIFLTLVQTKTLKKLCEVNEPDSGLPYFKYINFVFVNVFLQHLVFYVVMIMIRCTVLNATCHDKFNDNFMTLIKLISFIQSLWIVTLALYLKSFVYNIYASSMVIFRLNAEGDE